MDFSYSERTAALLARVSAFMAEHVYPAEPAYWTELEANTAPMPSQPVRWPATLSMYRQAPPTMSAPSAKA